jgi:hypothetical protein
VNHDPAVPNYPDRDDALTDEGYYKVPRTFADLFHDRAKMIDLLHQEWAGPELPDITCDHCSVAHRCQWAFDPYNTNGDCLDEK